MAIYVGTKIVKNLCLADKDVERIYLGTQLVYQKGSGPVPSPDILFDNGWVSGIAWDGNLLPRPQYTSIGTYNFSDVETAGHMDLLVESASSYSAVNHNCHLCTTELIQVPETATVMKIQYQCSAGVSDAMPYLKFGLLTATASTSVDDTGGQLSAWTESSAQTLTTQTLTLNAGMANGYFRAIVNMRRSAKASHSAKISIFKVWFE